VIDEARQLEAEPSAVLSVRGITTEYSTRASRVTAVRGVSFDLAAGEKLGIVGESGAGKSALALSILDLIEPPGRVVAGEVWLNGRKISGLADRAMRRIRGHEISAVFQDPMTSLDPVKTIGSQLKEAIQKHQRHAGKREVRRRSIGLLEEVEIPQAARRLADYPHQYSGGMRQRVMLAIALANEPDVVIADEPTTALDVTMQAQVLALMERLVERRRTAVMLITHNFGIVAEFCTSVQVMYAGRIVERGRTRDVFRKPGHPYTEALLGAVLRPDRRHRGPLPAISGAPPNLAELPHGCAFEPRCALGHGREVCRVEQPPPVLVDRRAIECHFAPDRIGPAVDGANRDRDA
jgi:oligopeptide/dipeptide ABC transporter ATP-binding protein